MSKFKFKKLKRAFRKGASIYKCSIGVIRIGYVEVFPEGKYVVSKKEELIDEIKTAFEEQECG